MKPELARSSDESRVKQLLAECQLPFEDITPSHLQHFLITRQETRFTGVIGLELLGTFALLRSLAVGEPFRGQGIASQLTKQAEDYARAHKIESLYLLTTTAESFFAKRGYQTMDRSRVPTAVQETAEFQSICPATAVCMVKTLKIS